MSRFIVLAAGVVVATLAVSNFARPGSDHPMLHGFFGTQDGSKEAVNRGNKSTRLAQPRPGEGRHTISVVEIVGVNQATIVYRDREGRELFRTDPVRNVTVIAKNLVLPEVTIRERHDATPQQVPLGDSQGASGEKGLEGCDPVASPLASPTLANRSGRCLAAKSGLPQVASVGSANM